MANQPRPRPVIVSARTLSLSPVDLVPELAYRWPAMNVVKATRQFEDWLGRHTDLIKKDLHLKHANMKA